MTLLLATVSAARLLELSRNSVVLAATMEVLVALSIAVWHPFIPIELAQNLGSTKSLLSHVFPL